MQNREPLVETVKRLLRHGATANLKNLLLKLHAADLAYILTHTEATEEQDQIFALLEGFDQLPQVYSEAGSAYLESYLKRHPDYDNLSLILQRLPSDDMADLVGGLPEEMSREILGRLEVEHSQEISGLLQYSETTAGGLMSTEVFKLKQATTVGEAIKALQKGKKAATVFYIYVVDEFDNLAGVLSIRQLFQVNAALPLAEIMLKDVVRVKLDDPQDVVAKLVAQYDLVAVPVVDNTNKLVGVITVDDVIDVIKEEAAENVLKMGSAGTESLEEFNWVSTMKKRLPWFLMLFVGGILTCEVIATFYQFLPGVGVFAGFIPLILRFGGIITRQTSTIVIQGMESGLLTGKIAKKILMEQGSITLVVALISSLLVGFYSFVRFPDFSLLPLAIGLALFCSMIVALILGLFIPLAFSRLKLDPALATGSLINFILDVLGLLIYFGILITVLV